MNKKYGIGLALPLILFLAGMLTCCKSGETPAVNEDKTVTVTQDNKAIYEDIKQAERIFNALPSPLESAMLIKSAGAKFDETQMNPISKMGSYVTQKEMALNLGIYTCDLSFASLYEQTQLIIDYMNAAKKMADGLGILDAIDQETIDGLEENINNTEYIMDVVSQTFMESNSFLEENGQPAVATMVLVGGWFEGLYISTRLVDMKDFNGNKLVGRIIDQKLSIDILLNLLNRSKGNPAVDDLIKDVTALKVVFDKISISASPVSTEYDQSSNSTMLKSKVKTDMSQAIFRELATTVAQIRNSFVKI